jgi:hypothetical protein
MRGSLAAVLIAAFAGLSAPADGSAQAMIHVAGGASFPSGDYADFADPGWLGHAGVALPVGDTGLAVGAAGYYGRNSHALAGDETSLYGGLGVLSYAFGSPDAVSPFVVVMAGSMVHSYGSDSFPGLEESDTGFALGGGAGVAFPLGAVAGFVEGWLLNGFFTGDNDSGGRTTTIVGLDVGVQLAVGGRM